MRPILEVANLRFSFGSRLVLRDLSLTVPRGSTLGIIGPNGGGKTTLLRLILTQLRADSGTILIDGLTPRAAVRSGQVVGYLPQQPQLARQLPIDVTQLVRLGLAGRTGILRRHTRADLIWVDDLIARVGLADERRTAIGDLSGGLLQRALIARALAGRPRLLLLDEPTIGVDRRGQQEFIELIQQLQRSLDLSVVFVSHDLRAVTAMCDRIACLAQDLHFHDTPDHMPADLVYRLFACDLATLGLGEACINPTCDGRHREQGPDGAPPPPRAIAQSGQPPASTRAGEGLTQ